MSTPLVECLFPRSALPPSHLFSSLLSVDEKITVRFEKLGIVVDHSILKMK